jgi:hypothetical protein
MTRAPSMSRHKMLRYIIKHSLPVPVYSAPHTHTHTHTHTPNQIKSTKVIDIIHHISYKGIFLFYFIMFTLYLYILYYSLQNYICGHICQVFIITTHYYDAFLYFNNS